MSSETPSVSTVLVFADNALASSIEAVGPEASEPFSVHAVSTSKAYRDALDARSVDCVVSRTVLPDAEHPVILYPETPDSDCALASTDENENAVRYLPQSIDTEDHALLVDAIENCLERLKLARECEIHESERDLLVDMSQLADVGGWEFDLRTETLTWTAETYRIHGLPTSFEPTVETAIEFYQPSDRGDVRADVEAAIAGDAFDSTYRLYRDGSEVRWVRSKGVPVYEDGDVVAVRGAYQDVTEQKDREDAIREFEQAVESAGHAIFITERNGTITYVNPAFEEVTGYDAEEVIGRDPSLLKSGEMDQAYYRNLWSTILSGSVWSEPIVNERKSGEHYHASETIAPITDDDGTVRGFVAIQTDVTEQVHTREQLETFREIVQRLEDPIMLQDRAGVFEVVNDAVADYAGLSKSELLGRDEFAFMDDASARGVSELKDRVIESEETVTYEIDPTFPTKGQRSFVTTRYPHYGEDGDVDGTVAICRDVTEQAQREHQLRVLDRILRHNLYNKMNLILGHAELLEDHVEGTERRSVEKIVETGNDLVDLADKERRVVDLLTDDSDPVRLDLRALLDELIESIRGSHPDAVVEIDAPSVAEVDAIPEVREALAELLGNAIVHNGGEARVSVRVVRDAEAFVVSVADNGPGIPEMEREAASGAGGITPLFHGSGLGLQFVHHVARRSGGTLRFESAAEGEESGSDGDRTVGETAHDGAVVVLTLPAWDSGEKKVEAADEA